MRNPLSLINKENLFELSKHEDLQLSTELKKKEEEVEEKEEEEVEEEDMVEEAMKKEQT